MDIYVANAYRAARHGVVVRFADMNDRPASDRMQIDIKPDTADWVAEVDAELAKRGIEITGTWVRTGHRSAIAQVQSDRGFER
jgi:hypothetical protein